MYTTASDSDITINVSLAALGNFLHSNRELFENGKSSVRLWLHNFKPALGCFLWQRMRKHVQDPTSGLSMSHFWKLGFEHLTNSWQPPRPTPFSGNTPVPG